MSEEINKHCGVPLSEEGLKEFQETWEEIEKVSKGLKVEYEKRD